MYILLISVFVLSLKGLCYINFHLKFSHFTTFSHTKKRAKIGSSQIYIFIFFAVI
jgi:hypothetical protein